MRCRIGQQVTHSASLYTEEYNPVSGPSNRNVQTLMGCIAHKIFAISGLRGHLWRNSTLVHTYQNNSVEFKPTNEVWGRNDKAS